MHSYKKKHGCGIFLIFDVFIPFNDMMEDIRERPTIFLTYLTYRRHIYKSNYVKILKKMMREKMRCAY